MWEPEFLYKNTTSPKFHLQQKNRIRDFFISVFGLQFRSREFDIMYLILKKQKAPGVILDESGASYTK
jgi:hypothetical protein